MLLEEITDDTPLVVPVLMNLLHKGEKVGLHYQSSDMDMHFMGMIDYVTIENRFINGENRKELEIRLERGRDAGYFLDRLDDCADLTKIDGVWAFVVSGDHSEG